MQDQHQQWIADGFLNPVSPQPAVRRSGRISASTTKIGIERKKTTSHGEKSEGGIVDAGSVDVSRPLPKSA
jgi:hypothetical protein